MMTTHEKVERCTVFLLNDREGEKWLDECSYSLKCFFCYDS